MDLLYRPSRDEIERASSYLVENFGANATSEACRLTKVYRRRGARRSAKIYRIVAGRLAARFSRPNSALARAEPESQDA